MASTILLLTATYLNQINMAKHYSIDGKENSRRQQAMLYPIPISDVNFKRTYFILRGLRKNLPNPSKCFFVSL